TTLAAPLASAPPPPRLLIAVTSILTVSVSVSATSFNRFLPKANTTRDNVGRYRSSEAATVFRVSCSVSMSVLPLLKELLLSLRCF
ncbi:hypothetical protein S245_044543, partial [Arachis hypogaea]